MRWLRVFAWAWTIGFALLAFVIPLARVGMEGLGQAGARGGFFEDPFLLSLLRITLIQASLSAAFSVLIGFPIGLGVKLTRLNRTLLAIPYTIPTVVVAMVAIAWLGRSGLDLAYSLQAVIIAHVFLNAPWVALLVAQAREQVPRKEVEAARTLGASSWNRLRFVLWPHLRAPLLVAGIQVFNVCVMSFVLVLLLGGGPPVETLETAIYSKVRYGDFDLQAASTYAFWQMALTLIPWLVVLLLEAGKVGIAAEDPGLPARSEKVSRNWISMAVCAFFVAPYLSLFTQPGLLKILRGEVWEEIALPLRISFLLAFGAAGFAVTTALLAVLALQSVSGKRLKAFGSAFLTLPGGVSVLVLSLGVWLAYGDWIDPFEGSLVAMMGIQAAIFFPLALRILWPLAQNPQTRLLESAATLGAGPFARFRWVEWPRWKGAVFTAFAMVAGASIGEVAAVSLFYSESLVPLPLVLARWMGQYRFDDAQGLAALLWILSVLILGSVLIPGNFRRKLQA